MPQSSLSTRVRWETLRSINSATFTGAYQAIGMPLAHDAFLIKIVNNSTSLVTISIDGATLVDVVPSGGFFLYDERTNASRVDGQTIPKGTQFYVVGAAGVGFVYLVAQYTGD